MSNDPQYGVSPGTHPSMFRANNLTPEEQALLRRLRHESAWQRGYPFAAICGGVAAFITRKRNMSTAARIAIPTVSAVVGNMIGKLSYVPTILNEIKDKLPEDSILRQQVELQMKGMTRSASPVVTDENNHSGIQFSQGSEYDSKSFEPEKQEGKMNRYITYEELRRKNRAEGQKDSSTSQQPAFPMFDTQPSIDNASSSADDDGYVTEPEPIRPKIPVRYNKYGDPVVE